MRRYLYGLMGLLSLLGFLGIFTEERLFLAFFAFAVDFEYFFIQSDEMVEAYMDRSASLGFYCGMVAAAVVSLVCFLGERDGREALLAGFSACWAVAVIVHALSTAYYGFREKWGLEHDQE